MRTGKGPEFRSTRSAGRVRGYYEVYLDGSRIAWIGQVRLGLWVCAPVVKGGPEPVEGPLSVVKEWVQRNAREIAAGKPVLVA